MSGFNDRICVMSMLVLILNPIGCRWGRIWRWQMLGFLVTILGCLIGFVLGIDAVWLRGRHVCLARAGMLMLTLRLFIFVWILVELADCIS